MVHGNRAAPNISKTIKTIKHILVLAGSLVGGAGLPAISRGGDVPVIVTEPENQMTFVGSNVTFSVGATGDELNYQWYVNDATALTGATNASLTLTDVQPWDWNDYSVVVYNSAGSVISLDASLVVLTVVSGSANPYAPGTLGYDLFQGTFTLASATNRTATYAPNVSNLGSNSTVWTWPVNLSCVGYSSDGYQSVLIASNELLVCAHYGGEAGQTVTFHDTNGVAWVAQVVGVTGVIADMEIAQLDNPAPASIVIPYVLPPEYANYVAGYSLQGMPAFWLHKNTGHIDYAPVAEIADADWYGYGTWMDLAHDGYGFNGTGATGGDSGSPAFMIWSNNPVLLFATSLTPDAAGMFVSGPDNWNALAAAGLTNGMRILDVSGYPLQSAESPAADYNYLVPPTSQVAGADGTVTFSVGVYVLSSPPFSYQWQCNGTNLAGATNPTLTIEAVPENAGAYTVEISNEFGTVTTAPVTWQLPSPPGEPVGEPLLPSWGAAALLAGLVSVGVVALKRRAVPTAQI